MRIIFYGGRQAGMIQLLTLLALGHKVVCVIPVDETVEAAAKSLGLEIQKPKDINEDTFIDYLETLKADLFVCCHGRQIIKPRILRMIKAINTHPCLYKYKGIEPIRRLLEDKNTKASVAVHFMAEKVDEGEVIIENFKEITSTTVDGAYNELYPLYSETLIRALQTMECFIRRARQEDAKRIWEIRNDPMVRQQSSSQDYISFVDHKKWFEQAYFQGKKNLCFVVMCEKEVMGYCRFDFDDANNAYNISLAVDPLRQGKGLGHRILSSALLQIPGQAMMNAAVKKDNQASVALFRKNNFMIDREDEEYYYFSFSKRA